MTRQAGAATVHHAPDHLDGPSPTSGRTVRPARRDGGLIPGGTYGYTVTATNADGSVSSTQLIVTLPVDPALLLATSQLAGGRGPGPVPALRPREHRLHPHRHPVDRGDRHDHQPVLDHVPRPTPRGHRRPTR